MQRIYIFILECALMSFWIFALFSCQTEVGIIAAKFHFEETFQLSGNPYGNN